jgi:hypothetical protein
MARQNIMEAFDEIPDFDAQYFKSILHHFARLLFADILVRAFDEFSGCKHHTQNRDRITGESMENQITKLK